MTKIKNVSWKLGINIMPYVVSKKFENMPSMPDCYILVVSGEYISPDLSVPKGYDLINWPTMKSIMD